MKNKDSISLTLTANGGFILDVPNSGTYSYTTAQGLLTKLIEILNETGGRYGRIITNLHLTFKGDDDEEM